jgi:hypothetical protein
MESSPEIILCCLTNNEDRWQVLRLTEEKYCFEKTLLPGQRIEFKAPATAWLEIYSGDEFVTTMLKARILCSRLRCPDRNNNLLPDARKRKICVLKN